MSTAKIRRLQALFDPFNEAGDVFWLFHKMVGYNSGDGHAHTIKVVS